MADQLDRFEGRYPSLRALHVFDAVMRFNGLRAAAERLFITPQAVSQQIKSLEGQLQVQLFRRSGRNTIPTEGSGDPRPLCRKRIPGVLGRHQDHLRGEKGKPHQCQRDPALRRQFFDPETARIPPSAVELRHPAENERLQCPDFNRDDIDVAILWGFGQWAHCEVKFLFYDYKVLCCAPSLTKGPLGIREPDDVARHTLLRPVRSVTMWRNVLTFLGATRTEAESVIEMYDADSMRRATIEGLGVGLISRG